MRDPRRDRPPEGGRSDSFLGAFYGPVGQVVEALLAIADLGIDDVYIGPHDEYTYEQLAPHLLTRRSTAEPLGPDHKTG